MVKALKGKGTYCVESWEILVKIWNLQKKKWHSGKEIYYIWNEKKHEWVKNTLEFAKTRIKTVTLKSVKPQWHGTITSGLSYMNSEFQRKNINNPE